jgi:hypothetical protein
MVQTISENPYEYVKYKILNAPIITYPFPHIMIDDIFPKKFYQELLENIPTIAEFTPKPKYPGRKTLTLDEIDRLNEKKKKFWEQMEMWFKSEDFSNTLLKKFGITKPGVSDYFLHKDLEDFEVTPHTDVHSKLVTYLFYLPNDDSLSNLGTKILVPKNESSVGTTKHQRWEDFNIVNSSKYIPNSFLSFTPCENSFHAVKIKFPEKIEKKERNTIRGFVFDKTEKDYPAYLFDKK